MTSLCNELQDGVRDVARRGSFIVFSERCRRKGFDRPRAVFDALLKLEATAIVRDQRVTGLSTASRSFLFCSCQKLSRGGAPQNERGRQLAASRFASAAMHAAVRTAPASAVIPPTWPLPIRNRRRHDYGWAVITVPETAAIWPAMKTEAATAGDQFNRR